MDTLLDNLAKVIKAMFILAIVAVIAALVITVVVHETEGVLAISAIMAAGAVVGWAFGRSDDIDNRRP